MILKVEEIEKRGQKAAELAQQLYQASLEEMTPAEKKERTKLHLLIQEPNSMAFIRELTDRAFRSHNTWKVAKTVRNLLQRYGEPKGISWVEKLYFKLFYQLSPFFAPLLVPPLKVFAKAQAERVILPGERGPLKHHLEKRKKEGVRVNLNRLGEAILGEEDATDRLETYLQDLKDPEIDYISVKLTTLYSQVSVLDFDKTISILEKPLRALYRVALDKGKFVNLDMEEWRDVELTKKLFIDILNEEEFRNLEAGIVLQSYLPTALSDLEELIEFAKNRKGAPIKIRLVKGANLGMETIESSKKGWPLAAYDNKTEVDANFIVLLEKALQKEHAPYLKIGVGSHNLFTIAYALLLRKERGLEQMVSFEMLEGMNEPVRRVVQKMAGDMLLYCPVAKKEDFHTAFAYLIRRLDENTGDQHFLRTYFEENGLEVEKERFFESLKKIPTLKIGSFRTKPVPTATDRFENVPDTDFTLEKNRDWIVQHLEAFLKEGPRDVPSLIGGKIIEDERDRLPRVDPSFPSLTLYHVVLATAADGERAVQIVKQAQKEWSLVPFEEKADKIKNVANLLRKRRGELIAAIVADGAKTVQEADGEISEAIDFAEYYIQTAREWNVKDQTPKGVVLVASPWNFPLSIPSGGIIAALLAGNGVVFKPSLETPLVGWRLAQVFWEAGVPKDLLAFVVGLDETLGTSLIQNREVNMVVLTGATQTARHMASLRPGLDLAAETGGKNSLIVTALADRDAAVRDIVASAFSHSGQKCSALSLLILEEEVYRDPQFRKQLVDAARSLKVGSPWSFSTKVPPLITSPSEHLKRALTSLDEGEEWLLKPERDQENPNLFSPGIKIGVKEGSYSHQTELFGPLLSVMKAKNLDHAITIANGTPYGLTAGLHTLDEEEKTRWIKQIRAGNLYINRPITGAIVRRQPFGGCKASHYGIGSKAGGPNYISLFFHWNDKEDRQEPKGSVKKWLPLKDSLPSIDQSLFESSIKSYQYWWESHYSQMVDPSQVKGEENLFGYVPHQLMVVRVEDGDRLVDPFRFLALCQMAGVRVELSVAPERKETLASFSVKEIYVETQEQFIQRMGKGSPRRVRLFSPAGEDLLKNLAKTGSFLVSGPVPQSGKAAFLSVLREVAISSETHRYGSIMK